MRKRAKLVGWFAALAILAAGRLVLAEGEWIVMADATADPCGLGGAYGAVIAVRLNPRPYEPSVRVVSCGNKVLPPLTVSPSSPSVFRRPRAVAVDPRDDNSIILVDSDSAAPGVTAAVETGSTSCAAHKALADPPGRVFRIDRKTGVVSVLADGTQVDAGSGITLCGSESAFVNPQAVAFNTACATTPATCKLWVVDSSANPHNLVSGRTGKRFGAVFEIPYPTPPTPPGGDPVPGPLTVRSDGSNGPLQAGETTAFGRLRGIAVAPDGSGGDVLFLADSSADPANSNAAGNRPGVVWKVDGQLTAVVTGQVGAPLTNPAALVSPFGVAVEPGPNPGRVYVADADLAYTPNPTGTPATFPQEAMVGPKVLPGTILAASLPLGQVIDFADGHNSAAQPICYQLNPRASIFANPSDLLHLRDDTFCAGSVSHPRPRLVILDADAHPTCENLVPYPALLQRFDFLPGLAAQPVHAPGAPLDTPGLGSPTGLGSVIRNITDGRLPAFATILEPDTTSFSTPQRGAVYRDHTEACREVFDAKVWPRLCEPAALPDECFAVPGARSRNEVCTPLRDARYSIAACDAWQKVKDIIEDIGGADALGTNALVTCACSAFDCQSRLRESLCRLCQVLVADLGVPAPDYPAICGTIDCVAVADASPTCQP